MKILLDCIDVKVGLRNLKHNQRETLADALILFEVSPETKFFVQNSCKSL